MQTLEQKFAALTYTRVSDFAKDPKNKGLEQAQYKAMAKSLPILVCTAGLTQALAFVENRGSPAQHLLLEDLAQVAAKCNKALYMEQSRNLELQEYVYLIRKTMIALKWFKRFAESLLEDESTAVTQQGGKHAP